MAGEKVLVIDDRIDNIKFLREYVLEPNSYQVITADNGLDGLKIALGGELDLIISDIMMPKMGGLEMLERLRQEGVSIPTILMTFHGSEETAVQAFRLGAQNYIIKPFAIHEMLNAVDRALAESRLRQERDDLTQTLLTVNQQLQSRLEELRFLYGIGRSVTSLQNLEPILNRIVEASVYLTKAEEGSLMLIDEESGDLYLRAACNIGEKRAKSFRIKIEDSIAGQVIRTGRPVMVGGSNPDDSFKVMTGYFVKALLNVPLKVGEQIIGVLAINNRAVVRSFDQSHLHSLTALANYASIAIENARLYAKLSDEVEQSNRRLEEKIESHHHDLQHLNIQLLKTEKQAALSYMGAGIAKSMRRPIKTMLSDLEQLAQTTPPDQRGVVASLTKETFHCRKLLKNLVDFVGPQETQSALVDLNQLIKQAWNYHVKSYPNHKIKVFPQLENNLPPIQVDRNQIQQAFSYLLHCIHESTPEDGKLQIITALLGQEVQLILSHSGEAFTPHDLQHIFDPFYETERHAYGLDLAIVQGIISRHNGRIEVHGDANRGNTFIVYLPAAPNNRQNQP